MERDSLERQVIPGFLMPMERAVSMPAARAAAVRRGTAGKAVKTIRDREEKQCFHVGMAHIDKKMRT